MLLLFFIRFSFFCRWYSSRRAFMSLHTHGSEALVTARKGRREGGRGGKEGELAHGESCCWRVMSVGIRTS
jgi:hypothetical protein